MWRRLGDASFVHRSLFRKSTKGGSEASRKCSGGGLRSPVFLSLPEEIFVVAQMSNKRYSVILRVYPPLFHDSHGEKIQGSHV